MVGDIASFVTESLSSPGTCHREGKSIRPFHKSNINPYFEINKTILKNNAYLKGQNSHRNMVVEYALYVSGLIAVILDPL